MSIRLLGLVTLGALVGAAGSASAQWMGHGGHAAPQAPGKALPTMGGEVDDGRGFAAPQAPAKTLPAGGGEVADGRFRPTFAAPQAAPQAPTKASFQGS